MAAEFMSVKSLVKELMAVSAERDKRNVAKMDVIVDAVVTKFTDTIYFPVQELQELDDINTRLMAGTSKFKEQLVNNYKNLIYMLTAM